MVKFRRQSFVLLPIAYCLLPQLALSDDMSLKYDGYWEGIKAGEVTFKNVEVDEGYESVCDIDTSGVIKTLTNFYSHAETKGLVEYDKNSPNKSDYSPISYDSKWQTKKNSPHIIVNYTDSGEASEIADPPENRNKRPEIDQQYKKNSFDLISTFLNAREEVKKIVEASGMLPQKFQIKVFDARRVFNANFAVISYENKRVHGEPQKLLHITLSRSVISGFTKKELEKINNFNPTFDLYLDSDYIPVLGSGEVTLGKAEMQLTAKCLGDNCN